MREAVKFEPEYGWACAWTTGKPRPFILIHTVNGTRVASMQYMGDVWKRTGEDWRKGWRRAHRNGCRCIRVSVSPAFLQIEERKADPTRLALAQKDSQG